MPLCVAVLTVALTLAGCSDDPGLQERLVRLQAEVQEKNRQLLEAQSALEKTKVELRTAQASSSDRPKPTETGTRTAAPQFLAKERVEESYASASQAMQKRVEGELKDSTIEKCTLYPVVMPTAAYPYNSRIALTIRSDSGHSYRLEFPVSADVNGTWTFPAASDINGALADSRQREGNTETASRPPPTPNNSQSTGALPTPRVASNKPTPPPTTQLVPGQTSSETHVIDWGDHRASPTPRQQPASGSLSAAPTQPPPPRQGTPSPQGSPTPQKAMPSNKDVMIHW